MPRKTLIRHLMKRLIRISLLTFLTFSFCLSATAKEEENPSPKDTLFVTLINGCVDAFPSALVSSIETSSNGLFITTIDGQAYEYPLAHIEKHNQERPKTPAFTSFKFNNKFNDDVYTDVQCEIIGDSLITATVPSIGKRLTPSFQVSDSVAVVYVNGVRQHSKRSRHRFDKTITYMVCHPGHRVLTIDQPEEEEEEPEPVEPEPQPREKCEPVALTAEMLSTNAPSNYEEDPANLLDGNLSTIFHSTWGSGAYEKLPADSCPYLDVHLPEALHHIQFSYTNRPSSDRHTTALRLYAGTDGTTWKAIRDFHVDEDGLPTEASGTYRSPTIDLGDDYTYLRFEQLSNYYRSNYIQWAEFALWRVILPSEEPDDPTNPSDTSDPSDPTNPIDPDLTLKWEPFGNRYSVVIDWPTDRAVTTPRIDINIEGGAMVSSKSYYLNAAISIDGADVFPSLQDSVQIKGRGNSSWNGSDPYAKNPYRLKFKSKVKPFGLTKGKNWVLQANAIGGSMMANAVGMKVARMAGAAGANHVIPVELYINGGYRGSYIFTEKVGLAGNSIDVDDESVAALLELDSYYDETYKFRDSYYSLPVNIKDPDFSDPTSTLLTQNEISSDFNLMTAFVKSKSDVSSLIDVDAYAAFYLTNELIDNLELMHPKSTFLYKADYRDSSSKYIFGPVWDLDWAFGYEVNRSYFQGDIEASYTEVRSMEKNQFWRDLRRCGEPLDRAYYKAWKRFMDNSLDEVVEYCGDYYNYAKPSLENNATKWSDGRYYNTTAENAKRWLRQRAEYIFATLTPYDISDEEEEDPEWVPEELPEVPIIPVGIETAQTRRSSFTVFDLRGVMLKRGATYDNWRSGLAPGIYIVNGKKVLVP